MEWHDRPKLRDHPGVQDYIDSLDPGQRRHVETMRRLVREDPDVVECIAWNVPFWFRKAPLCYASAAEEHITLGFARGVEIEDRHEMLTGTGKSPIRKTTVQLGTPFPEVIVRDWLQQAFRLDEAGEAAEGMEEPGP